MNRALSLNAVPLLGNKVYLATFAETMIVLSVFTKEIATRRIFGIDFDFIAYTFALGYFLFYLNRIFRFSVIPWKLYAYLFGTSMVSIALLHLQAGGFLKQMVPIFIIFSVNFFIVGKYDWKKLFKLYVKIAYFTAIFGLVQVFLSFAGVNFMIKIPGRLDSIAYEPSHYASILVPALVYTFFHFKDYKRYFYVMLGALILTFNLTGYLAFLIVISIAYINPVYLVVSLPVLYFLVFHVFVDFNANFNMRIRETQEVFRGDLNVVSKSLEANGTTVSLYSNLIVAEQNLKNFNIIGSGLGGHEQMYHRYYENSIFRLNYFYGLNAPSGHSMTIRIFSELGLLGLIAYVFMLGKRLILLDNDYYRSISLACLSHFVCKTFKLGGFIDYGTPFFLAMLFINYLQYKRSSSAA